MRSHKRSMKKIALTLSVFLILMWAVLGAGTSLAWFTDTDETMNNIFHFADFDLDAEYLDKNGEYQDLQGATEVFDSKALYEPGYTQVVYLRVTNKGEVGFKFKTAVRVKYFTEAVNAYGQRFHLQDHLEFGIVTADTEDGLRQLVANRALASAYADMPLNNYDTDFAQLDAAGVIYMAVVIHMPEDTGNVANYRGDTIPRVDLALTITASQLDAPEN